MDNIIDDTGTSVAVNAPMVSAESSGAKPRPSPRENAASRVRGNQIAGKKKTPQNVPHFRNIGKNAKKNN